MNVEKIHDVTLNKEITNGAKSVFVKYWEYVLDHYGIPFSHNCIKILYAFYTYLTFFNVMLFLIKFVPVGIYMHYFIKKNYVTSRERMKLKQLELEELQLQIQIMVTKLSVYDADFAEREALLRRKVEIIRKVRAQIRDIIVADEELRNALSGNVLWDENANSTVNNTSEEERNVIVELLKALKYEQVAIPELDPEMLSCGEQLREESPRNSAYSSASDADGKQDCHVKIVKVTNVYKVAYLRHFIKQKQLRRANKHALLRKKIDNIRKLLDDWQKTLNMVINSKLSFLNNSSQQIELASQEAMGDCSKPNFFNSSDSDSDFRNSADNCHDDYSLSWSPNQYKPIYTYNNYEDDITGDTAVAREYYDVRDYEKYQSRAEQHDYNKGAGVLYVVPEETKSQLEIKEIQSDVD